MSIPAARCARSRCPRPAALKGVCAKHVLEGAPKGFRSKYRNVRVRGELRSFDSKAEAARDAELVLLEKAGEIKDLRRQVMFDLVVGKVRICGYRADWTYTEDGKPVVEDMKGYTTDVYLLKRKLMLACHGIEIRESKPKRK